MLQQDRKILTYDEMEMKPLLNHYLPNAKGLKAKGGDLFTSISLLISTACHNSVQKGVIYKL